MTFTYHWIDFFKWNDPSTYSVRKKLNNADPKTFQMFTKNNERKSYGKDKDNVYYEINKIIGADLKTFEILNMGYSKDKNNVYFLGELVKERHADSFEVLDHNYSKDKNHVYFRHPLNKKMHTIEKADPASFEILNIYRNKKYLYAKDKNFIFSEGNLLCSIKENCLNL